MSNHIENNADNANNKTEGSPMGSYTEDTAQAVIDRMKDGNFEDKDWAKVQDNRLVVGRPGTTSNSLVIDLDMEYAEVIDNDSAEGREIPMEGQMSRIRQLFKLLDNPEHNKGVIGRKTKSIIDFQVERLPVHLWTWSEPETDSWLGSEIESHLQKTVEFVNELPGLRRQNALSQYDFAFVKVGESNEDTQEEIDRALESLFSLESNDAPFDLEDVSGASMRDRGGMKAAVRDFLVGEYTSNGYTLLGGEPDSGILIFLKNGEELPTEAEKRQRLAKILLRGGTQLENGSSFEAKLVEFPEDKDDFDGHGGYRDGIFMIMKKSIGRELAKTNGFRRGSSWQGHLVRMGETAMKGMMLMATDDLVESLELLGTEDAVISLADYRKIFGKGEEGQYVTIHPEDIWVMEKDDETRVSEVRLSHQAYTRAPRAIQRYFEALMAGKVNSFFAAARSEDKRDLYEYLPSFNTFAKMKEANLHPTLKVKKDGTTRVPKVYDTLMDNYMSSAARKGIRIKGANTRLFHDSTLSVDTGEGVPGISAPQHWGVDVGDYVVLMAYPILAAQQDGKSTGIVIAKVERVHDSHFMGIHPQVALWMLRDEDGDKLVVHIPNQEDVTPEMRTCGVADLELTTRSSEDDHELAQLFAHVMTGCAFEDSSAVLDVYFRLSSAVGIVDNRVTSALLYMGPIKDLVETPTGEPTTVYMSKAIQASIEGMKHATAPEYDFRRFNEWLEVVDAEYGLGMFDDEGKFVKHPELVVRKPVDEAGYIISDPSFEDVRRMLEDADDGSFWLDYVRGLAKVELTEDGFVHPSHYREAALELAREVADKLVASKETRNQLYAAAEEILSESFKVADASDDPGAMRRYLERRGLLIRQELLAAESTFVDLVFMLTSKSSLFPALSFCSTETLSAVSQYADGEINAEEALDFLGVDGRHTITSDDKADHIRTAMKRAGVQTGLQRVRLYGNSLELLDVNEPIQIVDGKKITQGDEYWMIKTHDRGLDDGVYDVQTVDAERKRIVL